MFEYIFKTLPRILFEPVSVAALLGILLYLFLHWKRKDYRFWLICTAVFFLLGWRIAAYSIMASKRYSEILIYPGIIFTCYFCLQFPVFLRWFLRKTKLSCFPHSRIICRYLPYFCIAGIAIACLTKAFYINTYSGYIVRLCDKFNRDSIGKTAPIYIHSDSKEIARIRHYCNIPEKNCSDLWYAKTNPYLALCDKIHHFDNVAGTHYFFRSKTNNEKELLPADLDLKPGSWREIAREYTSRKKQKELILYCYIPPCENIQNWTGPIPEQKKEKSVKFYDFETGNRWHELDLMAHSVGHKSTCRKKLLWPAGWWLDYNKKNPDRLPIITVSESRPLAGKKSLQISTKRGEQQAWIYGSSLKKNNYSFSLFVRGNSVPVSEFIISIRAQDPQKKSFSTCIKKLYFYPQKDNVYRIHWQIYSSDFPVTSDCFLISVGVTSGSISLDQFEIRTF